VRLFVTPLATHLTCHRCHSGAVSGHRGFRAGDASSRARAPHGLTVTLDLFFCGCFAPASHLGERGSSTEAV